MVAIEKNIDVQSAIETVLSMIESTINRYFEVKANLPKFDSKTNELIPTYLNGIGYVCRHVIFLLKSI